MVDSLLMALLLLFLCVLGLGVQDSSAQDLGGFFSPGPLAEPHAHLSGLTQCVACHEPGAGVRSARCLECHDHVREQVESRSGFHADKAESCVRCHPDHRGRDFDMLGLHEDSFDHDATRFPLRGAHARLTCLDCHVDTERYQGADTACVACHSDVHQDPSGTRELLTTCELCHSDESWQALPLPPVVFDHTDAAATAYPLEGGHLDVPCTSCHIAWKFLPTAHERCTMCHDNPHRAPFGEECTKCHPTPESWRVARFDHTRTAYPLEGVHQQVPCASCHRGHVSRRLAHDRCDRCHTDPHSGSFDPEACSSCHTLEVEGFKVDSFDHDRTGFPLEFKHAEVPCEKCHPSDDDVSELREADCSACHDDAHKGDLEPTRCDACHVSEGWAVDGFDHAAATDFPLLGAHIEVKCQTCHGTEGPRSMPHEVCTDCHTKHPHAPETEPATCAECHTEVAWADVQYDHANRAEFALEPQHVEVGCTACHSDVAQFGGAPRTCPECHDTDRPRGHYPGACDDCHTGAQWTPAGLGDLTHDVTGFELEGAHARAECASCHDPHQPYGSAAPGCSGCHSADDPHRGQLGRLCEDCHGASSWFRTRWRHQVTGWPLRGGHRLAACEDCHALGFVGTPTACWRCHLYEAPADVAAHASANVRFCDDCHARYRWTGAVFSH